MSATADNKNEDSVLKIKPELPTDQRELEIFVKNMVRQGKIAELIIDEDDSEIVHWKGDIDSIVGVGYPFLVRTGEIDPETKQPKRCEVTHRVLTKISPQLPFKLIVLFWDAKRAAYVCVREEAYAPRS